MNGGVNALHSLRCKKMVALFFLVCVVATAWTQDTTDTTVREPTKQRNTRTRQNVTEALRAATDHARDLITLAVMVAGATIAIVINAAYKRPDAWQMRIVYLLFPVGWFCLARSIHFGIQLRGVYLAHLFSLPTSELDFICPATIDAQAQRVSLEWGIYVFAFWLSIHLVAWIWPVPLCGRR